MKILTINAGSSSLKYCILDMPNENVIVSGICDRIGSKNSFFSFKINGTSQTVKLICKIKDHRQAVQKMKEILIALKITY